uniref:Uncharacterized protein n=2 Tax=Arion vulgaris TaxID=1028688 RepID=A0A0B7B143_9EUPU
MSTVIQKRRWSRIKHVVRMDTNSVMKTALRWTLEGKQKHGRTKTTWRRTLELKEMNNSWNTLQKVKNREECSAFVAALIASSLTG